MKSFFRFLGRNRLYTVVEVVGMAVAIAFVLFIGTFLIRQGTLDAEVEKDAGIYVGHSERLFYGSATVKEQVEGKFPEIRDMCRMIGTNAFSGLQMEMRVGQETYRQDAIITDPVFFSFFPFPLVYGRHEDVLAGKSSILLSERFARNAFGRKDPVGEKVVLMQEGKEAVMTVSGVFKEFGNSVFHTPDIIYRIDLLEELTSRMTSNGNGSAVLFFKLEPGTDAQELSDKIGEVLKQEDNLYKGGLLKEFHLMPFHQVGYAGIPETAPFEGIVNGDFIRLFMAAGILLLVFAVFNYVSLTVAQIGFRAREMASRRLLGSRRREIVLRYVGETFFLTLLSFVLGLFLVGLFSARFSILLGKDVYPLRSMGWEVPVLMICLIVLLTLLAGGVPAWMISRCRPVDVVRGDFARAGKMHLGKALLFVQGLVALVTLCVAFVMSLQLRHLLERPVGYRKAGRVAVMDANKVSDFRIDQLRSLACVDSVGWLMFNPMTDAGCMMDFKNTDGTEMRFDVRFMDISAFRILGHPVLSQNTEPLPQTMYLTESAMRAFALPYTCTSIELEGNSMLPVCGIMGDYVIGTGQKAGFPQVIWLTEMDESGNMQMLRELVVKVKGDPEQAAREIRDFYRKQDPSTPVRVSTYAEIYGDLYRTESRNLKMVALFTLITLVLSALALLAMSAYYARQHAKDAAVRKVVGCGRVRLFRETAWGFLQVVLVSAVFALPSAYLLAGRWLEDYGYRIDNPLWAYFLSAVFLLLVALASITWQTSRLIRVNPVEALKRE